MMAFNKGLFQIFPDYGLIHVDFRIIGEVYKFWSIYCIFKGAYELIPLPADGYLYIPSLILL